MPTPDKKRSSDAPLSADTKRQRVSAPISPATSSSIDVFDISVFMEDKFNVFPERLREAIQEQHEVLLTNLVRRYERGQPLKFDSEFTTTRKVLSYPRDEVTDFQFTRPKRYSDISLANQAILQEFRAKVPKRQSKITELKLEARERPMANPALAQCHSVRNGEMGWAFDKFECLSLHVTNVKADRLRHESIWVERVEPKTVKNPTKVRNAPATVKKEDMADQKKATADEAPSAVNLPPVNPTTASTSTANPKTVDSMVVKVEDDEDDCRIVEGHNATKGSKLKDAATVKETTTVEKEAITDEKKVTTYKAPTAVEIADDNEDDCVIVDGPNAAK